MKSRIFCAIVSALSILLGMSLQKHFFCSPDDGIDMRDVRRGAIMEVNTRLRDEKYGIRFRVNESGDVALVYPMVTSARKLAEMSWQADKPASRKAGFSNE